MLRRCYADVTLHPTPFPYQLPVTPKCCLLRSPEKVTQLSEKLNLPLGLYSEMEHTVYMRFIFTHLF